MISKPFDTFESDSDADDDGHAFVPFGQIAEKVVIKAGIAHAVRRCHELSMPLEDQIDLMQDIVDIILDTRDFNRPLAIRALVKSLTDKEPRPCRDAPRLAAANVREA